jgi:dehydrogenase/reductase SDR family member 1
LHPLSQSVAIVTGASRGIGRSIAVALGAAGAKVYVTARSPTSIQNDCNGALERVAEEISCAGGQGLPVFCDQADDAQIAALVQQVEAIDGKLNILVNNAFPVPDLQPSLGRKFWDVPIEIWRPVIDVGLRSHYIFSTLAMPMLLRSKGLLVNISSAAGQIYYGSVVYGLGKAGMDRMVRDMAVELEGTGVTAVSLWPGVVRTEFVEASLLKEGPDFLRRLMTLGTAHFDTDPWAQSGTPELLDQTETGTFTGRAVVALACDQHAVAKSGWTLAVTLLAEEYGFTDVDGRRPDAFMFRNVDKWPSLYG